jgi:hypothetical protein
MNKTSILVALLGVALSACDNSGLDVTPPSIGQAELEAAAAIAGVAPAVSEPEPAPATSVADAAPAKR